MDRSPHQKSRNCRLHARTTAVEVGLLPVQITPIGHQPHNYQQITCQVGRAKNRQKYEGVYSGGSLEGIR
jgi:hypothetical protein